MGSLTRAAEEETAGAESEEWSDEAVVYVNGVRRVLPDGLAHLTLLQYLRGRSLTLCVFAMSQHAED
jgi:xanthine dehydrogenase/oxidase